MCLLSYESHDTKTILIQNYIVLNKNMRCCMPFSWRIKNYLEELWVHALHQEGKAVLQVLYLSSTLLCISIFFCKSKETIGYYHYITEKCIYCFFLGLSQQEFDGFFWNTPLGRYIAKTDLEMQTEFFQRYLQDFICMTMNVTCQEDIQVDFFCLIHKAL